MKRNKEKERKDGWEEKNQRKRKRFLKKLEEERKINEE